MDTGERVWTTQLRADLIDGFFASVSGAQPLGTATQLSEELLTRLDPERVDRHVRDLEPDSASRRTLTFTRRHGMMRMTVDLDEAAAVVVRSAVEAAAKPLPTASGDDTRSVGQRRHDGLVDLVTTGAHHPASSTDPVVAHKATVVLRATLDDTGAVESGTATADTHGPVTDATLRAASCDGDVTVAVMDRLGRPRSLHTLERHATDNQRLIVAERDRGCIAPGCGAPAWACHLHHVVHWSDGGPTSVDNLVLLCGRDHRALHAGRLEARFGEDGLPETRRLQRDLGKLMTPDPGRGTTTPPCCSRWRTSPAPSNGTTGPREPFGPALVVEVDDPIRCHCHGFVLPHAHRQPAVRAQVLVGVPVASGDAGQLHRPPRRVRSRQVQVDGAGVPEAPVDEECDPRPAQHDVGPAATVRPRGRGVDEVAQPPPVQFPPQRQLGAPCPVAGSDA